MLLPNRNGSTDSYRYGFQGQEKDDEIKGEGNSINYKFRMHDPRIGRFFAVDPLTAQYPEYSPYSFSGNKVINAIELEGLEEKYIVFSKMQAESMKLAFKKHDYMEVARIADYGMTHGFVDDDCNPSKYIYEKLKFTNDYEFLRENTASIAMFNDKTLQKGMMVFEAWIYSGKDDKYGNPIVTYYEIGRIDLDEVRKKANGRRWVEWIVFMKENNYPQEHFTAFRDNGAAFANGGDVSSPPVSEDIKWSTGAFDSNPNSMNRTNQASDVASWSEFIEDYQKKPEKYQKAAKDYIHKFFVPAMNRMLKEKYEPIVPVEFDSQEDMQNGKRPKN